jgi:hypothetical protein
MRKNYNLKWAARLLMFAAMPFLADDVKAQCATTTIPTSGSGCVFADQIDSFSLNSISAIGNSGCSPNAYQSFSNPVWNLSAGQTYPITMTVGSSYPQSFAIWIDLNNNNIYEPTEAVFVSLTAATSHTGTITIPSTAIGGNGLRMRIRCQYITLLTANDACTNITGYGEVEDYFVNIAPACVNPTVNLGPDQTVCGNKLLDAGAVTGATYLWNTGATTQTINATASGTYSVVVSVTGGCSGSDQIVLGVDPLSVAGTPTSLSGNDVCEGLTANLSAVGAVGTVDWQKYNGSTWTVVGTGATYTTPPFTIPTIPNQYRTVVKSGVCPAETSTSTLTINVDAAPSVGTVAASTNMICSGDATKSFTSTGSIGSVVWFANGVQFAAGTTVNSANFPTATGMYSVAAYSISGICTPDSSLLTVEVKPLPSAGWPATITECGSATLNAMNPGMTYFWATGETTQTINVNYSGVFTVDITDQFGCVGTNSVDVTILDAPILNLGAIKACDGDAVNLNAGNPGATYLWSTGETTQSITVTAGGNYSVAVVNPNGCALIDTAMVTLNANPVVTYTPQLENICIYFDAFNLAGGLPAGGDYSGTGVSANMFNPATAGVGAHTVTYEYTDNNGCSAEATATLNVQECLSVEKANANAFTTKVVPNPNNGLFTLQLEGNNSEVTIQLIDLYGKTIRSTVAASGLNQVRFDVSELPTGIYNLTTTNAEFRAVQKVVIKK